MTLQELKAHPILARSIAYILISTAAPNPFNQYREAAPRQGK
jgi:hypothetical protein